MTYAVESFLGLPPTTSDLPILIIDLHNTLLVDEFSTRQLRHGIDKQLTWQQIETLTQESPTQLASRSSSFNFRLLTYGIRDITAPDNLSEILRRRPILPPGQPENDYFLRYGIPDSNAQALQRLNLVRAEWRFSTGIPTHKYQQLGDLFWDVGVTEAGGCMTNIPGEAAMTKTATLLGLHEVFPKRQVWTIDDDPDLVVLWSKMLPQNRFFFTGQIEHLLAANSNLPRPLRSQPLVDNVTYDSSVPKFVNEYMHYAAVRV